MRQVSWNEPGETELRKQWREMEHLRQLGYGTKTLNKVTFGSAVRSVSSRYKPPHLEKRFIFNSQTHTKAISEAHIILHALKLRVNADAVFYWGQEKQTLANISRYVTKDESEKRGEKKERKDRKEPSFYGAHKILIVLIRSAVNRQADEIRRWLKSYYSIRREAGWGQSCKTHAVKSAEDTVEWGNVAINTTQIVKLKTVMFKCKLA